MTNPDISPILSQVAGAMPRAQEDSESEPGIEAFTNSVAWHYGNPLAEQRVVEAGVGAVDLSFRRVIAVSGPERLTWLNTLLSQNLLELGEGQATRALNLNAQGHVLDAITVTEIGGVTYLEVDRGAIELQEFLTRMIFWSDVEVAATDLAVVALVGAGVSATPIGHSDPVISAADTNNFAGIALPATVNSVVAWPEHDGFIRRAPGPTSGAVEFIVPRSQLAAVWALLIDGGAQPLGLLGYEAERINALIPIVGVDTDERTIPHEVPSWIGDSAHLGAVHLDKGCYRGQETVSRVHNLGRPPRVLLLVHLDGSAPELPTIGSAITASGRTVGRLGSVAQHIDYGPIGLALIKQAAIAAPELLIGDVAVQIDPAAIPAEQAERPGRVAINKLRGRE